MTETEWLKSGDPEPLSGYVRDKASERKIRLFLVACNGLTSRFGGYEENPAAIEIAERYADGLASEDELRAVWNALDGSRDTDSTTLCFATAPKVGGWVGNAVGVTIWRARDSVDFGDAGGEQSPGFAAMEESERRSLVVLVRDIFGNPFRPVTADPSWLTSDVVALAARMYEGRDFSAMPVLADALQDAGCGNEDVLNHCRGEGAHVRGCWVADLLLGKK